MRDWRNRAFLDSRTPFFVMPLLMVFSLVTDVLVHRFVFGTSLTHAVVANPQEWWMRLLAVTPLAVAGIEWYRAAKHRTRQDAQLKAAHERVRDLNSRLARGEALSRGEVATRLHEDVAQSLSAAGMFLSAVDTRQLAEQDAGNLRSARRVLERVTADVRDLSQALTPSPLADFGLVSALDTLARRVSKTSGVRVDASPCPDLDEALRPEAAMAAFQVVCELVQSAANDALTSSIAISTECTDGCLLINVDWDGVCEADLLASDEWLRSMGGDVIAGEIALGTRMIVAVPASDAA